MKSQYLFTLIFLALTLGFWNTSSAQDATYITNTGSATVPDGVLNTGKIDASTTGVIDILALHRMSTGTAANGIGGSIMFRNQVSNGGLSLAGRISSITENAAVPGSTHAMKFDVYSGGFASNTLYLDGIGLGVGTTAPTSQLDVLSTSSVPATFRGTSLMYIPIYEDGNYRGYWGSYSGNDEDVDIGTGGSNTTGKLHLAIKAVPKLTIDSEGKVGVGTETPATRFDLQGTTNTGHLIKATTNYTGSSDIRAVEGFSTPADGWGYGGYFTGGYRGVYALGAGGTYTGTTYGAYLTTSGTGVGTRTAIYATASGGATNWAGYFSGGNVYVANDLRIGTTLGAVGYKLAVDGKIITEELRIKNSTAWPDYVFADNYDLMSIEELEASIKKNNHLPRIPSAKEVESEGILVGDMQTRMMEKIEELTLYIIDLNSELSEVKDELETLKKQ